MRGLLFIAVLFLSVDSPAAELLLFGGKSHNIFIGCLNCSKHDSGSVCNKYGDQGSKYNEKSIWNNYGDYGSRYSDASPWNKYASNPPAIVDSEGGFYGYFTSNKNYDKRTQIKVLLEITDNVDWLNDDLERARDAFCEE